MSGLDNLASDRIRLEQILAKRDPTPLEMDFVKGRGIGQLRDMLSKKARIFLKNIPNKTDEIEIATQEFLITIERTLSNFAGRASLRGYLVSSFQKRCTTHFNKITKPSEATVSLSQDDIFSHKLVDERRPFQDSIDRENHEIRQSLVAKLTPSIRQLIVALSNDCLLYTSPSPRD